MQLYGHGSLNKGINYDNENRRMCLRVVDGLDEAWAIPSPK